MSDQLTLQKIVEQSFTRATEEPTIARWKSCSIVAGCTAIRLEADGYHFAAACMEGVAEEARRQMLAMMPQAVRA